MLCVALAAPAWAQNPTINVGPDFGTVNFEPVYIQLMASGGTPPYTWTVTAGALPTGFALRTDLPSWFPPEASAGIFGVPTTPQVSPPASFTLTVTDAAGHSSSRACTLKIVPLAITDPGQLPEGFVGVAYSHTMTAANATGAVSWQVAPGNSLPPGLLLDAATGLIHGTPTAAGGYGFTIEASDSNGTLPRRYGMNVSALRFTSSFDLGNAVVGSSVNTTIQAAGGTPPYIFSTGWMPSGLQFSPSGVISGTLTTGGWTARPWITVSDSAGASYNRQFALNMIASPTPPTISYPNPAADAVVGEPHYTYGLSANGGKAPFSWSVSGSLPPGMSLRTSELSSGAGPYDAEIVGAPYQTGTYNFTVTLTDSSSPAYTVSLPLGISVKDMVNDGTLNGTRGTAYSSSIHTIGGVAPYHWTILSGALPAGLSLDGNTGLVSGTPTENGDFSIYVSIASATGSGGATLKRWMGIHISPPTSPAIQINGAPGGCHGEQ